MALLLWVKGPDDAPYLYRVAILACDRCGEERVSSPVMVEGELHGCAALGTFRVTERFALVRETPSA